MKKKVLSVLLCTAMTAAMLAGCGSSSETAAPAETEAPAEEEAEAPAEEEAEAPAEEDAEAPAEEAAGGVLVMGTNAEFPPYEYYEGQEIVGIDAEMAAAVAEKLGMELQIEDMAFESLITALSAGKVDMVAAGMTVTEERQASVNFSDSYATGVQVIIVKEDSGITGEADLNGKIVGVQTGTTGDLYADGIEGATVERYNKGMEAVQALSQGKIDAVIIDNEPAKVFVSEVEGLKILDEAFVIEDYAIAIAKDNDELLEKVNTALAELKEDGTLQSIVDKYITAE